MNPAGDGQLPRQGDRASRRFAGGPLGPGARASVIGIGVGRPIGVYGFARRDIVAA
jgi:hypothetical protein